MSPTTEWLIITRTHSKWLRIDLKAMILGKELNVSRLDKGVYILRVLEKDKVATRKLVIK